jgi:hypothetical protein
MPNTATDVVIRNAQWRASRLGMRGPTHSVISYLFGFNRREPMVYYTARSRAEAWTEAMRAGTATVRDARVRGRELEMTWDASGYTIVDDTGKRVARYRVVSAPDGRGQ